MLRAARPLYALSRSQLRPASLPHLPTIFGPVKTDHCLRNWESPLGVAKVVGGPHADAKLEEEDAKLPAKIFPYLSCGIFLYIYVFMGPACVTDPSYMPGGSYYPKDKAEALYKAAKDAGKTGLFMGMCIPASVF